MYSLGILTIVTGETRQQEHLHLHQLYPTAWTETLGSPLVPPRPTSDPPARLFFPRMCGAGMAPRDSHMQASADPLSTARSSVFKPMGRHPAHFSLPPVLPPRSGCWLRLVQQRPGSSPAPSCPLSTKLQQKNWQSYFRTKARSLYLNLVSAVFQRIKSKHLTTPTRPESLSSLCPLKNTTLWLLPHCARLSCVRKSVLSTGNGLSTILIG